MDAANVIMTGFGIAAAIMAILALVTVLGCLRCQPRQLTDRAWTSDPEALAEARKEAVARSSHFEKLMVAIGSVELGILSYVAGFVVSRTTELRNGELFYGLVIGLFAVTTVAYLHTWRVYMAYGCYIVQLEIAGVSRGLRTESEVFYMAQNPVVPRMLQPIVRAAGSIQMVALYPVFVLVAAEIGFGERLGVPDVVTGSLVLLTLSWSVMYAVPTFVEFLKLVNIATRKTVLKDDASRLAI